jgi:hypothetical protein
MKALTMYNLAYTNLKNNEVMGPSAFVIPATQEMDVGRSWSQASRAKRKDPI